MSTGNPTRPRSLDARSTPGGQAGASTSTSGTRCSVGPNVADRVALTPAEKTAAITKVRCLEHDLFEGGRVSRRIGRHRAEAMIVELNHLRDVLGWLEIDVEGCWRWPHTQAQ
jgi:hypothetical protein